MQRADQMFKRLKAARLDRSYEQELKRLIRLKLLIVDDFALRNVDDTETQDFYELVVERHLNASTVITSNRDPSEWLAVMADPLLAQSAIDRLQRRVCFRLNGDRIVRCMRDSGHRPDARSPDHQSARRTLGVSSAVLWDEAIYRDVVSEP